VIPLGDDSPSRTTPFVTYALIAANAAVYLAMLASGEDAYAATVGKWGFTPAAFGVVTLLTSMFMHAGILHIVGNMVYLWIFGDNIEDVLGHAGYLAFYVVTGAAAALGQYASDPSSTVPMIGASGAISGVLGAYLVLFPRNRVRILIWISVYIRVVTMGAGWALGLWFAIQLLYGAVSSVYAAAGVRSGTAFWAHIAGFGMGAALALLLLLLEVIKKPDSAPERTLREAIAQARAAGGGSLAFEGGTVAVGAGHVGSYIEMDASSSASPSNEPSRTPGEVAAALAAGDPVKAVELARVEMRMASTRRAQLGGLVTVGDALYHEKIYPIAYEAYQCFLSRAAADDVRLAEVKFRAGMIALRHLHDYEKARPLLADAARGHERSDRRELAQKELSYIDSMYARTSAQTGEALLSGSCAVIRQTAGRVNIADVGRIVAATTGAAYADATRLLKTSVGFVAGDVDPMKAKDLVLKLQEAGIPALIVPCEKLVAMPDIQEVERISVTPGDIQFKVGGGRAPVAKAWDELYYASAGLVTFTVTKNLSEPGFGSDNPNYSGANTTYTGLSINFSASSSVTESSQSLVFDVFTLNPFECYRAREGSVSLDGVPPGAATGLHGRFTQLLSMFLAYGRGVSCNEGVALVAVDAQPGRWRAVTFDSVRDFEQYNCWRLQLEQYG